MPVGLLTGLPREQIEAILLHELAHIRRCDYLVNVLQRSVEGLLFYHPAVWWISRVIRAERENCCDDVVVATSGNAHEYAVALAALEENRWSGREPAVAATGGNLVKRIRRLLYPQRPQWRLDAVVRRARPHADRRVGFDRMAIGAASATGQRRHVALSQMAE